MALERPLKVFHRQLSNLLAEPGNAGRFALVGSTAVDSVWATEDEALEQGYKRFGLDEFLVKQIVAEEQPLYCSRNILACRSSAER